MIFTWVTVGKIFFFNPSKRNIEVNVYMKHYLELNALRTSLIMYWRQISVSLRVLSWLKAFDETHVNLSCFFNPCIFPSESRTLFSPIQKHLSFKTPSIFNFSISTNGKSFFLELFLLSCKPPPLKKCIGIKNPCSMPLSVFEPGLWHSKSGNNLKTNKKIIFK